LATFNKFEQFTEDLAKKVHNLSSDTLKIALTNVAPVSTNAVVADLTEISYTNLSARTITTTSCEQTSGVTKLILVDLVLTASGGSVAAFRYVVLFNDTPTSPADPLIGWYDRGSSVTLADTETFTIDFSATNGVLTIT
jgi:hypothetical protein